MATITSTHHSPNLTPTIEAFEEYSKEDYATNNKILPQLFKCAEIYIDAQNQLTFHCLLCSICNNNATAFLQHIVQEHFIDKPFKCFLCHLIFLNFLDFVEHNRRCNLNGLLKIAGKCTNDCNGVVDKPHRRCEQNQNKMNDKKEKNKDRVTIETESFYIIDENADCDMIKKSRKKRMRTRKSNDKPKDNDPFQEHSKVHQNSELSEVNFLPTRKLIAEAEKKEMCHYCGKVFATLDILKKHYIVHTGEKNFKCKYCPKTFSQSCYVKLHERIHLNEKPFCCSVCGHQFRISSALRTHMKRHTKQMEHNCTYCEKTFLTKQHLRNHTRIHTGEKPFKCDICSTCFRSVFSMTAHRLLHSGEKAFKCGQCGKGFAQKAGLYGHEKTHINKNKHK